MSSFREYIPLLLVYPGHPRIAFIDGLTQQGNLNRRWIADWYFFERRERKPDGTEAVLYHLPIIDAMYEAQETVSGLRRVWYVGTVEGDRNLYRLLRDEVEAIVEGRLTICAVVKRHGATRRLQSDMEEHNA